MGIYRVFFYNQRLFEMEEFQNAFRKQNCSWLE